MKKWIFLMFLLTGLPVLQASPVLYELEKPSCCIEFEFDSTLHDVHGTVGEFTAAPAHYDPETGKLSEPFEVTVFVPSFDTGNEGRDKAMYKMFEAEDYPEIHWETLSLSCSEKTGDTQECSGEGNLRIRDQVRKTPVSLSLVYSDREVRAAGTVTLSLKSFHLKPPSILGLIRVYDEIRIRFDTQWQLS